MALSLSDGQDKARESELEQKALSARIEESDTVEQHAACARAIRDVPCRGS